MLLLGGECLSRLHLSCSPLEKGIKALRLFFSHRSLDAEPSVLLLELKSKVSRGLLALVVVEVLTPGKALLVRYFRLLISS